MPKANDNFCSSCQWWSFTFANDDKKFGTCENLFAQENIRVSQDYDSIENDEPTIYTEQCFGCIFYETGEDFLTEIKE